MKCKICGSTSRPLFSAQVLMKYQTQYFECPQCDFVQSEEPYWLSESYSNAITAEDTGIMMRNITNTNIVLATLLLLGKTTGRVVDYAAGYGILVRLLRDEGVETFWYDRYCENLFARGFEFSSEVVELATAFEAFEHFVDPMQEFESLFQISPNILFSTLLMPQPAPPINQWWYYGFEHGQHISFFRLKTLRLIAKKYKKILTTDGSSYHLISDKPISCFLWKLLRKYSYATKSITRMKLTSKTFIDHEHIVLKKRGNHLKCV